MNLQCRWLILRRLYALGLCDWSHAAIYCVLCVGLCDCGHAAIYCVLCVGLPHCEHSAAPLLFTCTVSMAPSVHKCEYSNVFVLLRQSLGEAARSGERIETHTNGVWCKAFPYILVSIPGLINVDKKPTICHFCVNIYFFLYKLLNMFRATMSSSLGAED